jgi:protein translocase SecG subunit
MTFLESALWLVVVVLSVVVIGVVLMQPSKDAGSSSYSFSGFVGSSGVLGVSSAGNFMTKMTSWAVFFLFVSCLALGFLSQPTAKHALKNAIESGSVNKNPSPQELLKNNNDQKEVIPD